MAETNLDPSAPALTALSGAVEVPAISDHPDRPLHPRAIRAARGIAEALFSSGGTAAPTERVQWLMSELDLLLIAAGWRSGGSYRLLLWAVTWLAPLTILRPGPLWRLGISDRVQALKKMEGSPAASLVLAMKAVLCLIYYEHPEAVRETGYELACQGGMS